MRKRETGQALAIVLIFLGIGALLAVPALRLTGTAYQSASIIGRQTEALYAADAAQEFVLWKLLYDGLGSEFHNDNDTAHFEFDVCGVPVSVTVIMRAKEGEGGTVLATDDKIKPTKTVVPSTVPDRNWYTYTYTIHLDQLSNDNSQGLDAIYDVLPGGMTEYIPGSSQMSIDGGPWLSVPDPYYAELNKKYLKWPADYNKDTGTGAFSSNPSDPNHYFYAMRHFEVRQVKELRFQVRGRLDNNAVHCNWVVLKPWNTLSGPQAPITVGTPPNPGECQSDQVLSVTKKSEPAIIQPGVETDILYTIRITNLYTQARHIQQITDYLPPEFEFLGPVSGLTTENPNATLQTINGIERYQLTWTKNEFPGDNAISIASNQTLNLVFWAKATKDVSGTYYDEVIALLAETGLPSQGFSAAGVLPGEYASNYSWNTGAVIVPAYDSQSEAEGVVINANMALILGGVTITSWQIR